MITSDSAHLNPILPSKPEGFVEKTPSTKKNGKENRITKIGVNQTEQSAVEPQIPGKKHKAMVKQIPERADIFLSARILRTSSEDHPLAPFNPDADNINDVYRTDFKEAEAGNVFFKPGTGAAQRSIIGYGITRMIDLDHTIAPAKSGEASIIAREDNHVQYQILKVDNNSYLAPQNVNFTPKQKKEWENGVITCKVGGEELRLIPDAGQRGAYKIASGDDLSLPVKEIQAKKFKEEPAWVDPFIASDTQWSEVSDQDDTYLAPKEELLEVKTAKNKEYATIKKVLYEIVRSGDGSACTLVMAKAKQNVELTEDPDVVKRQYLLLSQKDPEDEENTIDVLVRQDNVLKLEQVPEDLEDPFEVFCQGKGYIASKDEDGFSLTRTPPTFEKNPKEKSAEEKNAEDFAFFQRREPKELKKAPAPSIDAYMDNTFFFVNNKLVPTSGRIQKDASGNDAVLRNGQLYQVERNENGTSSVIGKNIKGMVQSKVENIFIGEKNNPLDIRAVSHKRDVFFDRIDTKSFIESFVATMLLRPQDGKVVILPDSNVLFQAMPNDKGICDPQDPTCPLRPVLIDLDETMPANNHLSQDPELTNNGKKINAIRNGLMAFPQARKPLSQDEKAFAVDLMKNIISKKSEMDIYLKNVINKKKKTDFNEKHIQAFDEVLGSMDEFLTAHEHEEWTLEDLFFHTFPRFKEEWNSSLLKDQDPAYKAMYIGKEEILADPSKRK